MSFVLRNAKCTLSFRKKRKKNEVLVYKVGDMETFRPSLAAKRMSVCVNNVTGFA